MNLDWHARFTEQARWTKPLRDYLLKDHFFSTNAYCLEVGSGTGVISAEFIASHSCKMVGVDLDFERCTISTRNYQNLLEVNGDAYRLPFAINTFDCIFCHYFLLWIKNPKSVMEEIFRVLKPGGKFFAFAEPDYHARIDHPLPLQELGKLQTDSLVKQGVNALTGRELPSLAVSSGFDNCQIGVSGYEQKIGVLPDWWSSEWEVLHDDLTPYLSQDAILNFQNMDRDCWLNGTRILWVPTFYLSCNKPPE